MIASPSLAMAVVEVTGRLKVESEAALIDVVAGTMQVG